MSAKTLRLLIITLLMFTGIFHLAVALLGGVEGMALPVSGFGVLYIVISFFVRRDTNDGSKSHSRNAIIAAIAACTVGIVLGGAKYFENHGPGVMLVMFLIDIAVIVAGVMWLMKRRKKKA